MSYSVTCLPQFIRQEPYLYWVNTGEKWDLFSKDELDTLKDLSKVSRMKFDIFYMGAPTAQTYNT